MGSECGGFIDGNIVFKVATLLGVFDTARADKARVGSVVKAGAKVPDAILDREGCDGCDCMFLWRPEGLRFCAVPNMRLKDSKDGLSGLLSLFG